ncbi:hypothetical protein Pmar_PMAR010195 [Perkinsus marinus ATCC 50983]|uniref:Uncharacterized protein n=1 Tax=Perkinsus marinus (strain ATCC 50983 / TXsc) TaxID=423536 RepID=C5K531_PERM5|nr:hypothetical protein Pmar_PMAR010195 [Perkinsus marinus ATCC 50983]EER20453.1 hypothetical protein Pmar_PMAR010195 [Perkinsus marinus ATCC 50983]|eukprot:XP_002788657.1 hypothetical protein Pmar_PMAR010195 [Perkinsus marinus ATCC 50983]
MTTSVSTAKTSVKDGCGRNEPHTAILLLMGKPHNNQSYQDACRHALLGVLSGVISVTTSALPGRDGNTSSGAVYATVVTRRALTEGYKKSLVRALSPYGMQAIVLSVESLRSLVLSQGVATTNIEADQAGGGRSVVKHKKKGKRNRRGRKAVSVKALPYQAKPMTMPGPTESQVKGQPLEEEESTTENNPGVANVEEPDRADEAAVVVECTPPCKEAPSSSRCDHFCISTPNDSEATGLGMENGMEDDNEHEDDFSIADAVGTWLGVDELDGDEDGHHRDDTEYLDQHGSPRARNAAATMTFFNSAATAFGFSKAMGMHQKFAGVVEIVEDSTASTGGGLP